MKKGLGKLVDFRKVDVPDTKAREFEQMTQSQKAAQNLDHVQLNRQMSNKVKDMNKIQAFYQNLSREQQI